MDLSEKAWIEVQKKTFTNWINDKLKDTDRQVEELETDFVDGVTLIKLLQVLSHGKKIGRVKMNPRMDIHKRENLDICFRFMQEVEKIHLVNIGAQDVYEGNTKLILGLLWALILRYQIAGGLESKKTKNKRYNAKKILLGFINAAIPGHEVSNFTTDWNDGCNLSAFVDSCQPGLIPNHAFLNPDNALENIIKAMDIAEKELNIPQVMHPEDLVMEKPDELSVMTYVSGFCVPNSGYHRSLLDWINSKIPNQPVSNFTSDWVNGLSLSALTNAVSEGGFPDSETMRADDGLKNCIKSMDAAELLLHVKKTVPAEEFADEDLDLLSRMTYLIQFRHTIHPGGKHYQAYEKALQDGISLTLRYLKFLFVGPPRSGKTSARRRLVQEIINLSSLGQPSKSTGAAETSDVVIKKLVCESTAITDSTWQSVHKSQEDSNNTTKQEESELQLAQWFYRLISAKTTVSVGSKTTRQKHQRRPTESSSDESDETDPSSDSRPPEHVLDRNKTDPSSDPESEFSSNDSEVLEIKAALRELAVMLQSDNPLKLEQVLKELIMISMVDVGGQPAFLEMLPSLTIGPALYFLFFRLDQELGKSYKVRYHASDHETETTLETSYCTENVLYQSLSSIACFGCHTQKNDVSSGVLLFGTYKDKVSADRISQVAETLEEKLLKSKLYQEGLLLKTSKGSPFFSLDNMNGDESEMTEIRSDIEEIVKKHFSATPIPAAWLMFRIVLHLLRKPVLSLAQCRNIAKRLSMPTSVEEALWFFHHNIGNLMYYSDIPSMQDTVICDPQVLFDSVSELIIDRFCYSNRSLRSHEVDEFHRKGLFSLAQIDDKTETQRSGKLKLAQMVDLLKDLNIIAEIKEEDKIEASTTDQSQPTAAAYQSQPPAPDQSLPKFIMPAVLKYASEEELMKPAINNPDKQSVPIMIQFERGFVPFGVFCATTAHIIANQDSLSPTWRLCDDQVMRNKVTFSINRAFFATVISRDQYLEIHVCSHPGARKTKSLSFICSIVRRIVINSLQAVISKMKFKPYVKMDTSFFSNRQPFDLAFTCCLEDSHNKHLMKYSASNRCAECPIEGMEIDLQDQHMVWFDEELDKRSESGSCSVKTSVTNLSQEHRDSAVEKSAQVVAASVQIPAGISAPPTTQAQPISFADKRIKLDELPTLDELLILKYMDKGKKKKVRIIGEASHKWKDIANLICGDTNVTSVLELQYPRDPSECLKQAFISYFISKKPHGYSQDWNGLIELLDDVDLETLADNIKQALS